MRHPIKIAAAIALLVIFLTGCAAFQVPKTQEGKYLLARTEFNNMMKDYIFYKEMLPLDQQAQLSMVFKPYFQKADLVLDNWGAIVASGGEGGDEQQMWLERKRLLMKLLIEYGIVEVK